MTYLLTYLNTVLNPTDLTENKAHLRCGIYV